MTPAERRQRSREQYRIALHTLSRMTMEYQPDTTCAVQEGVVANICSDIAATFAEDAPVRAELHDRVLCGTFAGCSGVRLVIKIGAAPVLVPADLVFDQDEEHSPSCVPSE